MDRNRDVLLKARQYAFLLLKFRPRSEREIYLRLKKKKFDEEVIKQTIGFLRDKDFLNDSYFAKIWIESRLKRPLGLLRIRLELELKGVDKEVIDSQIDAVKEGYREEDVVVEIARERINKLKGVEPQKARRRIYAYLLRRGFSPGIIIDVMNQL